MIYSHAKFYINWLNNKGIIQLCTNSDYVTFYLNEILSNLIEQAFAALLKNVSMKHCNPNQ